MNQPPYMHGFADLDGRDVLFKVDGGKLAIEFGGVRREMGHDDASEEGRVELAREEVVRLHAWLEGVLGTEWPSKASGSS